MRHLALHLLAAAALLPAPTAYAQVTQVPNTGCSGAVYPTHSPAARIGQPFTFGFSCSVSTRQAFAIIGVPSRGVSFYSPITCDPGPCVVYPAPISGQFGTFPLQPGSGSWTVNLPNHPGLIGSTWALQCACYCP